MSSAQDAANPTEIFNMLDKNNNGSLTKNDLDKLLEQFEVNGMAEKVLSFRILNLINFQYNQWHERC